jgi:ankyrin repeat protein
MNRAQLNPRSSYGDTPLGIAVNNGDKQIAKLLRQYGGKE